MAHGNSEIQGRKIFFLHPSAFVQNVVIDYLIHQEFEVYISKDENRLKSILKKYPDSIVFACIDEGLSPNAWEMWVRNLKGSPVGKDVGIGILSNTNNDNLRKLYLETCQVNCGFIPVKADKNAVLKILHDILNAAQAKGRRKYVRVNTGGDDKVTVNLPSFDDTYIVGQIRDISVVGFSCVFNEDPKLEKNSLFPSIQIKLHGTLLNLEGIVFGSRVDGPYTVYIFLFTPKIDSAMQAKIRAFIQKKLQQQMDSEIAY